MSNLIGVGSAIIEIIYDGETLTNFDFNDLEGDLESSNGIEEYIEEFANEDNQYTKCELANLLFTEERRKDALIIEVIPGYYNTVNFNCADKYKGLIECIIDWGDDSCVEIYSNTPDQISHVYPDNSVYTIKVYGTFNMKLTKFYSGGAWRAGGTLNDVLQFGECLLLQTYSLFSYFPKAEFSASDSPLFYNREECNDLSYMFYMSTNFNGDLSNWDMTPTRTVSMFEGCQNFNQSLDNINTKNLLDASNMFKDCTNFNQTLSWNTSKLLLANNMFNGCKNFNGDISELEFDNLLECDSMFKDCLEFNQDLNYDLSNVMIASNMFYNCYKFNSNLNLIFDNLVNANSMFYNCILFNNDISDWNVSNLEYANSMFYGCEKFNQNLNNWDTKNLIDINSMFYYCYDFNSELSNWNTYNVITLDNTFTFCTSFNQDLNNWNVINVNSMQETFNNCNSLSIAPVDWDTRNCVNMMGMFYETNLMDSSIDFRSWNVNKVAKYYYFLSSDSEAYHPVWKL